MTAPYHGTPRRAEDRSLLERISEVWRLLGPVPFGIIVGALLHLGYRYATPAERLSAIESKQDAASIELKEQREFLRVVLKLQCEQLPPARQRDLDLPCDAILKGRTWRPMIQVALPHTVPVTHVAVHAMALPSLP